MPVLSFAFAASLGGAVQHEPGRMQQDSTYANLAVWNSAGAGPSAGYESGRSERAHEQTGS